MEILYSGFNKIIYEQGVNLIHSVTDPAGSGASRKQRSSDITISGEELSRLNKTSAVDA